MAQIHEGLALAGDALDHITVGDRTYWYGEAAPTRQAGPSTAHLLQGYDEWIMGYGESRWVIDVAGLAVAARRKSVSSGVVVVDGQITGRWKRRPRARTVVVEVGLYTPLTAAQSAALEAEAGRYGAFLGVAVDLVTTRV